MAWSEAARRAAAETRRRNAKGKMKKTLPLSIVQLKLMRRTNEFLDHQRSQYKTIGSNPTTPVQNAEMKKQIIAFRKNNTIANKPPRIKTYPAFNRAGKRIRVTIPDSNN